MKKILLIALVITANIISISCSNNNDEPNPYQGNWSGNINGDIAGTWCENVSSRGNFNGTVIPYSTTPDHNFVLSGHVNGNGSLVATMKNTTYNITINFVGTFQNNQSNGTWIFNGAGMQGTWNGTKE